MSFGRPFVKQEPNVKVTIWWSKLWSFRLIASWFRERHAPVCMINLSNKDSITHKSVKASRWRTLRLFFLANCCWLIRNYVHNPKYGTRNFSLHSKFWIASNSLDHLRFWRSWEIWIGRIRISKNLTSHLRVLLCSTLGSVVAIQKFPQIFFDKLVPTTSAQIRNIGGQALWQNWSM